MDVARSYAAGSLSLGPPPPSTRLDSTRLDSCIVTLLPSSSLPLAAGHTVTPGASKNCQHIESFNTLAISISN